MLQWLKRNQEIRKLGATLYEQIVAQARSPAFYRDFGVRDTMEGRFEMIVLHLFLVRERLKREGAVGQRLGQDLLERLISDMDDALRQLGYDMGVARRVKKAAAAFGERSEAYQLALSDPDPRAAPRGGPDDRLETALLTHVYQCRDAVDIGRHLTDVDRLAAYVREASRRLSASERDALFEGRLAFPTPGGAP